MPKELSQADLQDILSGATILGSGGGGPLSVGQQILTDLENSGRKVYLADPGEVADSELMAVSAVAGSPDAAGTGEFPFDIASYSFNELEKLQKKATGHSFSYVLPGELGAGNTFIPFTVGASKSIAVVDAAGARRAIPTLTVCTYAGHNLPISPILIADNEHQVSFSAPDAASAEGPMRGIITSGGFGEYAGIAFWTMNGATMKQSAILGTTSYAQKLGATLRQALHNGQNPVEAVRQYLNGYILFKGRIVQTQETTSGAFDIGYVVLEDSSQPTPQQFWIYNQNENLIAWNTAHSQPAAIAPDLICYLTTDGQPFSNADLKLAQGREVVVIGAPTELALRSPAILQAFGVVLRNIGYAGAYVPIEKLQHTTLNHK